MNSKGINHYLEAAKRSAAWHEEYKKKTSNNKNGNVEKILDDMGVKRYCCRRMFISHQDTTKEIVRFSKF